MARPTAFFNLLSDALEKNILFAAFRLPGEEKIHFMAQLHPEIETFSVQPASETPGFVLAPFIQSEEKLKIHASYLANSESTTFSELPVVKYNRTFLNSPATDMKKVDYLNQLSLLIYSIRAEKATKVVFSRTKTVDIKGLNKVSVFLNLENQNKDSFVYMLNLPGNICWMGASPEELLKVRDNTGYTMALAATMKSSENRAWTSKELNEFEIVSAYIEKKLFDLNIPAVKSELENRLLKSGLKHLCRTFAFEINQKNQVWSLVKELHPTPAVCGIPVKNSLELINSLENQNRSYYTGFLGPCNYGPGTSLYVNLRCARFFGQKAVLYAGGGITADSNPNAEWEETELKTRTVLKAIES